MPDPDFTIHAGDTASVIQDTLQNSGGTAVSVSGATVIFEMAPISGGTLSVAGTATIIEAGGLDTGVVKYVWAATDTANDGMYLAHWKVTFSNGTVQTFPNADAILVQITGGAL